MLKSFGYHCSLERYSPLEHLTHIKLAEEAGFKEIMCSDHLYPWSKRQSASTQAWIWLSVAMSSVSLPCGIVTAPIQRYHPFVVAQAFATLSNIYPERLWCAFGSGQLLNEHITNQSWPGKFNRNERLYEAVCIIKALWSGETVNFEGKYFQLNEAKLYTLPQVMPRILIAALSKETAQFIAPWADGVITTSKPIPKQQEFINAFKENGGEYKPLYLQAIHSYAENMDRAIHEAWKNWRHPAIGDTLQSELKTTAFFDEAVEKILPEQVTSLVRTSNDIYRHLAWLEEDVELGFEHIYLQNVGDDQKKAIEVFSKFVIPHLVHKSV